MEHRATEGFWRTYQALPPEIRSRANKQLALLKGNPQYPSLQFKKVGESRRPVLERPNVASSVIIKNPGILGGVPVFANTRVPFQALLDYLEGGETLHEFLEDFPMFTREAAISALEEGKALVIAQFGMNLLLDECVPRHLFSRTKSERFLHSFLFYGGGSVA